MRNSSAWNPEEGSDKLMLGNLEVVMGRKVVALVRRLAVQDPAAVLFVT